MHEAIALMVCGIMVFVALAECDDPFIGTAGMGHVIPTARCPIDKIWAEPDTGNRVCRWGVHGKKTLIDDGMKCGRMGRTQWECECGFNQLAGATY